MPEAAHHGHSAPPPAQMANAIRALAMDSVEAAKSGHPGMPMGMADVATVLFTQFLKFDPQWPDWPDRDRFVLSAGHGSMLLYALLHLTGYPGMDAEALKSFRKLGSPAAGHPEYGHAAGIETTTGPLGQGLANAVGMAIAERHLAARFGADLVDHRTYVIAGDGCLMEGIAQEAITLAGHLKLSRLVVLFDDNGISIDGPTSLTTSEDQLARFRAAGWAVEAVDGHDPGAVAAALARAQTSDAPSLIACRTVIGYGAPTKAGSSSTHGSPLGAAEIQGTRDKLGWPHAPFEVPDDVRAAWAKAGRRGATDSGAWAARLATSAERATFSAANAGALPDPDEAVRPIAEKFAAEKPLIASRRASELVLEVLTEALPDLLGGSADLTGSNNTKTKATPVLDAANYGGRYLHYGIREHAMAAAMNGMALHGGVVPYGGTFLVFSDYCRPSVRLSALMGIRVVYVFTHDSIGLGEDGPTHQPVEHLAALRAIPNLLVFRPADAVETAEAWALALRNDKRPTVLALSRQNLTPVRTDVATNRSAAGAYELVPADGEAQVTLIATGSEVGIAVEAQKRLAASGIAARVVSAPCLDLLAEQPADVRRAILGTAPRIAIEAGIAQGWERWIGEEGCFIGMTGFGASAPEKDLYRHFGITADAVVAAARAVLNKGDVE
ncbi:transketolase [Zavarzinia sp. CC-PAN008]|uniref:transketolase n=1 Tax=Zavarzinia sp. CC-PAN008 TaxID=3243332 RepID=UPI003F7467B5